MLQFGKNLFSIYSLSSIGLIFVVYKIFRHFKLKNLTKTYFRNKTVLVTGASGGLGKGLIKIFETENFKLIFYLAIAEELYPLGAQLILCARNHEELKKVKSSLMQV